jgi:hypothetical protein
MLSRRGMPVTGGLPSHCLRSRIAAIDARSRRVFAGGLHVTSRSRCRRIRAFRRPFAPASAPRPARDIRTSPRRAEPAKHAVARARQREHPARASRGGGEPAAACALDGTAHYTSADDPKPTAPAETRLCIQCNIGGVAAASSHAYRTNLTADCGGSILPSTPRVISGERRSTGAAARIGRADVATALRSERPRSRLRPVVAPQYSSEPTNLLGAPNTPCDSRRRCLVSADSARLISSRASTRSASSPRRHRGLDLEMSSQNTRRANVPIHGSASPISAIRSRAAPPRKPRGPAKRASPRRATCSDRAPRCGSTVSPPPRARLEAAPAGRTATRSR